MKITSLFAVLSLAITLALGITFTSFAKATPAQAEETATAATVENAQFVDGNWFTESGNVDSGLQAQIDLYDAAVEADNTADAEKYAIRSWVKANYAAELGRRAMEKGEYAEAKTHLQRAVRLAKKAQKPGAGKGEHANRVDDDSAAQWQGTSRIEGLRAEAYAQKLLDRVNKKLGSN
jgi:hypothetical protein